MLVLRILLALIGVVILAIAAWWLTERWGQVDAVDKLKQLDIEDKELELAERVKQRAEQVNERRKKLELVRELENPKDES
jgi:hypothetical protein